MTTSSIGSYNVVPMGTWPQSDTANEGSALPYNSSNYISENSATVFASPNSHLTSVPVGPPPPRSTMAVQPCSGTFYPTPHTRKNPQQKRIDNSESGPSGPVNYVHQSYMPTLPPTASQGSFQAGLTSAPNLTAGNSTSSADGNLGYSLDSSQQFSNCGSFGTAFVQSNIQIPNTEYQYPAYTESRTILESIEQNGQSFQGFMNYQPYQYESVLGPNVYQETTAAFPPSSSTFGANNFDGNPGPQSYAYYQVHQ